MDTGGGEDGSSSVASVFGVAIFLGFLLVASQVLIHLYATSTVSAVAFDNARRAALSGGDCVDAVSNAVTSLGDWGAQPEVVVTCRYGPEFTTVTITGPSPAAALRVYGELAGQETIQRAAAVRTEGW